MDKNKYWVKIYRQIRDSAIWLSDTPFDYRSAWIDLIMEANVKGREIVYKGQIIKIKRGDVYTSIRKLAERWHWSKDKVTRYLKLLSDLGMIKRNSSVKCATLLTIVKYEDFQNRKDSNKDSNKDSDEDTDKDTHKDSDKDTDKSLLKNIKNDKEGKEDNSPSAPEDDPDFDWFETLEDDRDNPNSDYYVKYGLEDLRVKE